MVWGLLARGLLGGAFRSAGTRGVATTAANRSFLGSTVGTAARHPVLTTGAAAGADMAITGGENVKGAFNWAKDAALNKLAPENGGDWFQLGAGLMAGMNAMNGNLGSAAMFGVAAYFMDDILRFADNALESQGIDIIPDTWHTSADAAPETEAPSAAAPSAMEPTGP